MEYVWETFCNQQSLFDGTFVSLKVGEDKLVVEHINKFNVIVDQLNSIKIYIDNEVLILILLSSLLDNYSTVIITVSNSCGSRNLTFDKIHDLILEWRYR